MKYIGTRGGEKVSGAKAIMQGLSENGGLFVPEKFPCVSEKEFADIPVIFLTCKDDKESVKRVLSLKADGYLLKYLSPMDIKKRIDDFFKQKER